MPKDNEVDEKVIVANPESAAVEAALHAFTNHETGGNGDEEVVGCMRAALEAGLALMLEPVVRIGTCAEVKWLQGGPCQLAPKDTLYRIKESK